MVDKKPPFKSNWAALSIKTQANAIKDRVKNLKKEDVSKFARKLMKEAKTKMTYERSISVINKAISLIPHPAAKIAGKVLVKATPAILKGGKKVVERYDKYMEKVKLAKKRKHKAQSEITRGKETNITALEFPVRGKVIKKYGGPIRKAKYKD